MLAADGSQTGPHTFAQVVQALNQGTLRRESLVRRADLAEFFAVDSYPEFSHIGAAQSMAAPRVVKPKAAAVAKPIDGGTKAFVWGMVLVWVVLIGLGAKWAFGMWQESSAEKARVEAEKWKSSNLPEHRIVSMKKRRVGDFIPARL